MPRQSQLEPAGFGQPIANSGNVGLFSTEQSALENEQGSFLNKSGLIGHDLWKQLKRITIPRYRVIRELIRTGKQPLWPA